MSKLTNLIEKRRRLIEQSGIHRQAILAELENLHAPVSYVDKIWVFATFIKSNPLVMVSVMSLFSKKFRKLSSIFTGGHAIYSLFKKSKQAK